MVSFDEEFTFDGVKDSQALLALFDLLHKVRSSLGIFTMLRNTIAIKVVPEIYNNIWLLVLCYRCHEFPGLFVMIWGVGIWNNEPLEKTT